MKFIADFHIHSKYSRAVSRDMVLEELDRWADDKGILVMGTGDFTHPAWFKDIKEKLEPAEPGLFKLKPAYKIKTIKGTLAETRFLLTVEISGIYSRAGKTRRIHNLVFAPDIETAEKINTQLSWVGNLASDGRPILGLDSEELAKICFNTNTDSVIVPAHCLLPDTVVHTKDDLLKPIRAIKKGDFVITHKNRWRKVTDVFKRPYDGKIYHIKPRNFSLGLTTTSEHPFYAIKTQKNCHCSRGICKPSHINLDDCTKKHFRDYKPQWIIANQLERGDVLIFPRFNKLFDNHKEVNLQKIIKQSESDLDTDIRGEFIIPFGNKITPIRQRILIDKNFCKLVGYYLAEGYTNSRDLIGFAFSSKEQKYVDEVKELVKTVFGFDKESKLRIDKRSGGVEILFYSKILCESFRHLFYSSREVQNASTKTLPYWALGLPLDLQVEIFRCWWRGDSGYTTSRLLMNQMKIILLRLGIIPSIRFDSREDYNGRKPHFIGDRKIKARYGLYHLNQLSFYEDRFNLLEEPEFARVAKYNRGSKYGWLDSDYIYLPIYDIKVKDYKGEVYNLEVEEDNSYITEFAAVHNCWTPWFSVFGSMSGFDALEECFGDYAKYIFAVETGLSSDPAMNWRWSKLDNIALISNSDSHSLERIGREANIFDCNLSYKDIVEAIKDSRMNADNNADGRGNIVGDNLRSNQRKSASKFEATIEFFPEEGKYHYDGHRLCGVAWAPEETKAHGNICSKCGKPVTVGVMNRVAKLADRTEIKRDLVKVGEVNAQHWNNRVPFINLVTLDEIIGEALNLGSKTKTVKAEYDNLIKAFKSELHILMNVPAHELSGVAKPEVVEGIERVRAGKLSIEPGFDGEFGKIKIFNSQERKKLEQQKSLF